MGRIEAKIFSLKKGFEVKDELKGIKIVSKRYNILVMEDYLPVIGEVDGNVTFITEEGEEVYENVRGYYRHSHNHFELLLDEENDKERKSEQL